MKIIKNCTSKDIPILKNMGYIDNFYSQNNYVGIDLSYNPDYTYYLRIEDKKVIGHASMSILILLESDDYEIIDMKIIRRKHKLNKLN